MHFRKCFLCGISNNEITLFKFPKDGQRRSEWFKFCGLTESVDNVKNIKICSLHFDSSCFTKTGRLQSNAVPSISTAKKEKNKLSIEPYFKSLASFATTAKVPVTETLFQNHEVTQVFIKSEIFDVNNSAIPEDTYRNNNELVEISQTAFTTKKELEMEIQMVNQDFFATNMDVNHEPQMQNAAERIEPETTIWQSPLDKKRKFNEPRFVQEINVNDMSTPKGARSVLFLVKTTDKKKSHKINVLQTQNRRLKKRVSSLEKLIEHLRKSGNVRSESNKKIRLKNKQTIH